MSNKISNSNRKTRRTLTTELTDNNLNKEEGTSIIIKEEHSIVRNSKDGSIFRITNPQGQTCLFATYIMERDEFYVWLCTNTIYPVQAKIISKMGVQRFFDLCLLRQLGIITTDSVADLLKFRFPSGKSGKTPFNQFLDYICAKVGFQIYFATDKKRDVGVIDYDGEAYLQALALMEKFKSLPSNDNSRKYYVPSPYILEMADDILAFMQQYTRPDSTETLQRFEMKKIKAHLHEILRVDKYKDHTDIVEFIIENFPEKNKQVMLKDKQSQKRRRKQAERRKELRKQKADAQLDANLKRLLSFDESQK